MNVCREALLDSRLSGRRGWPLPASCITPLECKQNEARPTLVGAGRWKDASSSRLGASGRRECWLALHLMAMPLIRLLPNTARFRMAQTYYLRGLVVSGGQGWRLRRYPVSTPWQAGPARCARKYAP